MKDIGVTMYEGLQEMRADKVSVGDVLFRPGSSHMIWEVVEEPEFVGPQVKFNHCIERKGEERGSNSRNFTFRRQMKLKVMRVDED